MSSNNKLLRVVNDFVFKALFGREHQSCKIILMDFLNALLDLKGKEDEIIELDYLNPFNLKEYQDDKLSILDIKVKTMAGHRINIEMQVNDTDNYRKRSLYYWSKIYSETISESEMYTTLKKSIVINILDYNLLSETNKYHSVIKLLEKDEKFLFLDDLEIHFVELGKFDDIKDVNEMSSLEKWITFIKDTGIEGKEEVINQILERSEKIKMAVEMLEIISSDEIMRQKYLDREQARRDRKSEMYYAEQKGVEKVAKNMLSNNLDMQMISSLTGLSIKELEKLKKEL